MRHRLRKPSPALVVAMVALFVALTGTGVAAHLVVRSSDIVNNTIRSEDVVNNSPNSLGGPDIREGSLQGLVKGDAAVDTKRVELGDDGESVLFSLSGLGVFRAFCAGGSLSGSNLGFENTSGAQVDVWLTQDRGATSSQGLTRVEPGFNATAGYFGDSRVSTWHIGRGSGAGARSATIFVADVWDGSSSTCRVQATAVVRRG
jgi:hypothetical protein